MKWQLEELRDEFVCLMRLKWMTMEMNVAR